MAYFRSGLKVTIEPWS